MEQASFSRNTRSSSEVIQHTAQLCYLRCFCSVSPRATWLREKSAFQYKEPVKWKKIRVLIFNNPTSGVKIFRTNIFSQVVHILTCHLLWLVGPDAATSCVYKVKSNWCMTWNRVIPEIHPRPPTEFWLLTQNYAGSVALMWKYKKKKKKKSG